jgi:hypothetical protein
LILIWDADGTVSLDDTLRIITMAQETGSAVIGDRLRGHISKDAMQIANWFGNWFFALIWSPIVRSKPTDMLCGTKIFPRYIFSELPTWLIKNDPYGDFALVAFARSKNIKVFAFTVNKIEHINEMLTLGVDAIITDYPDIAARCLGNYKYPEK